MKHCSAFDKNKDERLKELIWLYCLKKEIDSINVSMKKIKKITKDLQVLYKEELEKARVEDLTRKYTKFTY